jgi:hypothetical protein
MKNKFIILIIGIIIIFGGIGVFAYHNSMYKETKLTLFGAGVWDVARCAAEFGKCKASLTECRARAERIVVKCGKHYKRAERRCEKRLGRVKRGLEKCTRIRERTERDHPLGITRCTKENTRCKGRANVRYGANPERLTRALQRCEDQRLRCISREDRKKERGLVHYERCKTRANERIIRARERHTECINIARERKLRCEAEAAARMRKLLARCAEKGAQCKAGVKERCPGIILF